MLPIHKGVQSTAKAKQEEMHMSHAGTTLGEELTPENMTTGAAAQSSASTTVDIHDLLDTLERASAIVKSHIEQQNGGYGSRRR